MRLAAIKASACLPPLLLFLGTIPAVAQPPSSWLPAMEAIPDARSMGMGRACTAVADGASAIWWNPGALGIISSWSARLLTDIDEGQGLDHGGLSVYALAGRIRRTGVAVHLTKVGKAESSFGERQSDALLQIGAGTELPGRFGVSARERLRWGVGASAKYYSIRIDEDREPPRYRREASGLDADVGSLLLLRLPLRPGAGGDLFAPGGTAAPHAGLRAAAMIRNLLGSEIRVVREGGSKVPLGRAIRLGIALEVASGSRWRVGPLLAGTISTEVDGRLDTGTDGLMRSFGAEVRLLDMLSYRYGETRHGGSDFKAVSHGFGISIGIPGRAGLRIDHARAPYPLRAVETTMTSGSIWIQPW